MCSPSWTLLSPPSPFHPSGSSQCTSPRYQFLKKDDQGMHPWEIDIWTKTWRRCPMSQNAIMWQDQIGPIAHFNRCIDRILPAAHSFLMYLHMVLGEVEALPGVRGSKSHFKLQVAQSCPTLCNSMDYMVHGILQVRILEWVAIPFSRGSSQPRDQI